MRFKLFIIFVICFVAGRQFTLAQTKFSKIKIDQNFRDTLTFVDKWDYPEGVYKNDSTGEFTTHRDSISSYADIPHLFFTANCSTNVQGGYKIRYCFADLNKDNIVLTFSDGLPAYASEFNCYIRGDSFCFRPKTIYPIIYLGEKITNTVTKQKLVLNKSSYTIGDIIIGKLDTEFIETVTSPKKEIQRHKFYLRGFIKTRLKQQIKTANNSHFY